MKEIRKKLLIILGPTATGKTDMAIYLAKKFNGELISCDSRQVYKGLDIGTGKLPGGEVEFSKHDGYWIIDGVKIWGYDIVSPTYQYTAGDFIKFAEEKINQILKSGKLPILVGGTGFYIKALLEGLSYFNLEVDNKLRNKLNELTLNTLQQKLNELNSEYFTGLNYSDKNNKRRLIRYIEIFKNKKPDESKKDKRLLDDFEVLEIGLTTEREKLYKRIDERVDKRIDNGMIEEAESLYKNGLSLEKMFQLGLEYRALAEYIDGKTTKSEMIKMLKYKIHQYAKRQLTWFKKDKDIFWFDVAKSDFLESVEKKSLDWYNN